MTAGEKIRKRRLELGITQKDVASIIGTTGAYVSAVEKQKRGVKKETRLAKFAEALQCSVNDLKSDVPKGMVDPTNVTLERFATALSAIAWADDHICLALFADTSHCFCRS